MEGHTAGLLDEKLGGLYCTMCILSTQNFFFQVDKFSKYHTLKNNTPERCAIFNKYLLNVYHVSIAVLDAGDRMENKVQSLWLPLPCSFQVASPFFHNLKQVLLRHPLCPFSYFL